jgi:hypothetical protein
VLAAEVIMMLRHRQAFRFDSVWRLIAASLVGIPLGLALARYIDEDVMRLALGLIVTGYALYALSGLKVPRLHKRWGYGFGLISGVLSGAYATGGPPYVVYGTSQRWTPSEFKVNLQTMFLFSSMAIILGNAASGRLTPEVWRYALIALPSIAIALPLGFALESRVSPQQFRVGVLLLLIAVGLSLLL